MSRKKKMKKMIPPEGRDWLGSGFDDTEAKRKKIVFDMYGDDCKCEERVVRNKKFDVPNHVILEKKLGQDRSMIDSSDVRRENTRFDGKIEARTRIFTLLKSKGGLATYLELDWKKGSRYCVRRNNVYSIKLEIRDYSSNFNKEFLDAIEKLPDEVKDEEDVHKYEKFFRGYSMIETESKEDVTGKSKGVSGEIVGKLLLGFLSGETSASLDKVHEDSERSFTYRFSLRGGKQEHVRSKRKDRIRRWENSCQKPKHGIVIKEFTTITPFDCLPILGKTKKKTMSAQINKYRGVKVKKRKVVRPLPRKFSPVPAKREKKKKMTNNGLYQKRRFEELRRNKYTCYWKGFNLKNETDHDICLVRNAFSKYNGRRRGFRCSIKNSRTTMRIPKKKEKMVYVCTEKSRVCKWGRYAFTMVFDLRHSKYRNKLIFFIWEEGGKRWVGGCILKGDTNYEKYLGSKYYYAFKKNKVKKIWYFPGNGGKKSFTVNQINKNSNLGFRCEIELEDSDKGLCTIHFKNT